MYREFFCFEFDSLEIREDSFVYRIFHLKSISHVDVKIGYPTIDECIVLWNRLKNIVYNSLHQRLDILCKYMYRLYFAYYKGKYIRIN